MRRLVPVDSRTGDWPRKIANAVNENGSGLSAVEGRVTAAEAGIAAMQAIAGLYGKARSVSASAAVASDDYAILADATAGAVTITLPAAASSNGRLLVVKKIDSSANAVTLDGNASETIDGAATQALSSQWDAMTVACNGSGWFIV